MDRLVEIIGDICLYLLISALAVGAVGASLPWRASMYMETVDPLPARMEAAPGPPASPPVLEACSRKKVHATAKRDKRELPSYPYEATYYVVPLYRAPPGKDRNEILRL